MTGGIETSSEISAALLRLHGDNNPSVREAGRRLADEIQRLGLENHRLRHENAARRIQMKEARRATR